MVSPLIGQGIALATKLLPNSKTWFLENLDSGEVLQGQFEPNNSALDVTVYWAAQTALNRGNSILQFLNGGDDTINFEARLFKENGFSLSPEEKLSKLISWARIDPSVRRPPVLHFYVGDGHQSMNCVITGIGGISYGRPDAFGALRDVSFSVSLLRFVPFSLDDTGETDTRYARAKDRDYHELLAQQEYGNPMLGVVIQQAHPDQQNMKDGDVVKLPSIEGVRNKQIMPRSISLGTAFGRKDTAQRRNRIFFFDLRSASYVSHVQQPSTTPVR